MKKISLFLFILIISLNSTAQTPDNKQLHETARAFMRQGDYANAILVLNRCLQSDPQNIEIAKDLALNYYFEKDNNKALEVIKPVLEREDADDQSFQVAGDIYKALDMPKECEKVYKKGLKKFPASGALYNAMGELLLAQGNYESIKQWEKGIEADPSYSRNYYNAAKFYFLTTDNVWSIIYAEVFINIEPSSTKTPEIKELLMESYKKLFRNVDLEGNNKDKNEFVRSYLQSMNHQSSVASQGINVETLSMIRTRFILDWNNGNNKKFPYQLFDFHRQLLQEGMFDAYNQWLFGSVQNLAGFQNWITTHATEYSAFSNFQKSRVFKIPVGQYYH